MKKFISIFAIVAVVALAFVSCNKDNEGNVKGNYSLDYDISEDTDLSNREISRLEDILDDMVEGAYYEDVTLNEVIKEVNDIIKNEGPSIAAKFPEKYFTVEFEIYNDKDECVKTIYAKCKEGKLL